VLTAAPHFGARSEKPNYWQCQLLRAVSGYSTAVSSEQGNECSSFPLIELHLRTPMTKDGRAGYSNSRGTCTSAVKLI
jgi:hypothetical protein